MLSYCSLLIEIKIIIIIIHCKKIQEVTEIFWEMTVNQNKLHFQQLAFPAPARY